MRKFSGDNNIMKLYMPTNFQDILDEMSAKAILLSNINELRKTKAETVKDHYTSVIETELWCLIRMIDGFKQTVLESMGELNNPIVLASRFPTNY